MIRQCASVVALAGGLACLTITHADGTLPPQPYRYLHPPPALKANNTAPASGQFNGTVTRGRSLAGFAFTSDGLAGIRVGAGAIRTKQSDTSYTIAIRPVETPAGLPAQLTTDGNAYSFVGTGHPSHEAILVEHPLDITLRWPHVPVAMYLYRNGAWKRICNTDTAILAPGTVTCATPSLGIVAAVVLASGNGTVPPTSTSGSGSSWLKYIILIAAVVVVVVAAALAFVVVRSQSRKKS